MPAELAQPPLQVLACSRLMDSEMTGSTVPSAPLQSGLDSDNSSAVDRPGLHA